MSALSPEEWRKVRRFKFDRPARPRLEHIAWGIRLVLIFLVVIGSLVGLVWWAIANGLVL